MRWTLLQPGWLKLNADVTICSSGSYIAVSVRDSCSSLCIAYIERLGTIDLLVGEAFALAEAATLAKQRNWSHVIFESDSLVL